MGVLRQNIDAVNARRMYSQPFSQSDGGIVGPVPADKTRWHTLHRVSRNAGVPQSAGALPGIRVIDGTLRAVAGHRSAGGQNARIASGFEFLHGGSHAVIVGP